MKTTLFRCSVALGVAGVLSAPGGLALAVNSNNTTLNDPNTSDTIIDRNSPSTNYAKATVSSAWWTAKLDVTNNSGPYHSYLYLYCDDGNDPAGKVKHNATNRVDGDLSSSCSTGWFESAFFAIDDPS